MPVSKLSKKVISMSASATLMMSQKANDLKAKGIDVISLSLGEPDFDTPDHIKEAAKKALDDGYTKYTPVPGLIELREAIVEKMKRDNGLDYSINQVMVSNGAKQCVANLCLALLDPRDEAIVFAPYWVSYFDIISFVGGTPVPIHTEIEQDFKVTPEQLEAAITEKTKFVLFSSPCNPTGSVYTHEELSSLVDVLDNHKEIIVVSDEIYEFINFSGGHKSIGTFEKVKDRTVTINGMSKGFAMTGWRLGYMAGPEWLVKACVKVQGQSTSGANAFSQKAAAYALLADMSDTEMMKEAYLRRRDLVIKMLSDIPGIKVNHPKGAFYIFPDVSELFGKSYNGNTITDANSFTQTMLTEAHVALVSGSAFGNDDCVRLSYAASEEVLIKAINRMKEVLNKYN